MRTKKETADKLTKHIINNGYEEKIKQAADECAASCIKSITKKMETEPVMVVFGNYVYYGTQKRPLNAENYQEFAVYDSNGKLVKFCGQSVEYHISSLLGRDRCSLNSVIRNKLTKKATIRKIYEELQFSKVFRPDELADKGYTEKVIRKATIPFIDREIARAAGVVKTYFLQNFKEHYEKNPHCQDALAEYNNMLGRKAQCKEEIERRIGDDVTLLFPEARKIRRHFVLHIGPTNSGKTHDAMQELSKAHSGTYLAPLRLMAVEQYDNLNEAGCVCSLITGEERFIEKDATHVSSTTEMADLRHPIEVAVIDEAQMIADTERGGAWTAAILGIPADTVHVCMAPEAEDIVVRLIGLCDDDYEIIRHERMTPLENNGGNFDFPDDVKTHDALIVFSRKNVYYVAAELQKKDIKCSILYGSMPYAVRRSEERKFREGESEVVVSTDCIGMGLNLPIKRVVFLETAKYDGTGRRLLTPVECRQIAGRAGRYGIFNTGYYEVERSAKKIDRQMSQPVSQIETAYIKFPESLINAGEILSETMMIWQAVTLQDIFKKESIEETLEKAAMLEDRCDDQQLVYTLATIPFAYDNDILRRMWQKYSFANCVGDIPEIKKEEFEKKYFTASSAEKDLQLWEQKYAELDLLYNFSRRGLLNGVTEEDIQEKRMKIVDIMNGQLAKGKLKERRCPHCGKPLSWNYPYGMCQKCYNREYGYDSWYDDWA